MSATPTLHQLLGKTVLIGITRVTHADELIDQHQYVGTVESLDQTLHIRLRDGTEFTLPPDLSAFRPAVPGIYRLRSTGEKVENPDFTASWTVRSPDPRDAPDE